MRVRVVALALLLALVVAGAAGASAATTSRSAVGAGNPAVQIRVVDVGQGDGGVIRVGKTIVVSDAGQSNAEAVDAALKALGATRIDVAIMSHPHSDHVRNFSALLGEFGWTIKTAVLSHSDYWQETDVNKQLLAE